MKTIQALLLAAVGFAVVACSSDPVYVHHYHHDRYTTVPGEATRMHDSGAPDSFQAER